jgi:chromosome segregation ATPase
MQLVVARVAAAATAASEASTRTTIEAAKQSAEDHATAERDSLVSRLALTEAEVERLRAATASAEEAAERARTTATTTEATARDVTQAAARKKAMLDARVSELECDLGTATADLATAGHRPPVLPGLQPASGGLRGGDAAAREQRQAVGGP